MEERQYAVHHIGTVEFSYLSKLLQVGLQISMRQHGCLRRTSRATREQHDGQVVCLNVNHRSRRLGDKLREVHGTRYVTRGGDDMRQMRE